MSTQLGRISFTSADAFEFERDKAIAQHSIVRPERRAPRKPRLNLKLVEPEPVPIGGRVCPGCNLRRTEREFRHEDGRCVNCHARGKA